MSAPRSVDDFACEREEQATAADAAWRRLYAEWLRNRAADSDAAEVSAVRSVAEADAITMARTKRGEELARLLTTTPAGAPWQIMAKIEVLEHYLSAQGGTAWPDAREIVMLAGIKADLIRFEPALPS